MSRKQWGSGFHTGRKNAINEAGIAAKELQHRDLRPFHALHLLMVSLEKQGETPLMLELHAAFLRSSMASLYTRAAWLMMTTGELADERGTPRVQTALAELGKALQEEKSYGTGTR